MSSVLLHLIDNWQFTRVYAYLKFGVDLLNGDWISEAIIKRLLLHTWSKIALIQCDLTEIADTPNAWIFVLVSNEGR